jgi:dTDP-4-dehydrorhamnose reductase
MNLLISGVNKGLGKYLHHHFQCDGFARGDSLPTNKKYDAVVHCAVSTAKEVTHDNLESYVDDNVSLTKRLCSLNYDKFIYISTVDVYPQKGDYYWKESDDIYLSTSPPILSVYGTTKMISESIVMNTAPNWLIFRCSTILNHCSRPNATMKLLDTENHWDIFLHGNSTACFVLASDIARFIKMSLQDDLTGIYNLAGSEHISLNDMSEILGSNVTFGEYIYSLRKADNAKVCAIAPFFGKTFQEAIEQFRKES